VLNNPTPSCSSSGSPSTIHREASPIVEAITRPGIRRTTYQCIHSVSPTITSIGPQRRMISIMYYFSILACQLGSTALPRLNW